MVGIVPPPRAYARHFFVAQAKGRTAQARKLCDLRHILKKAGETTFIPAFVKRQKAGKGKRKLVPIIPRLVFVKAPSDPTRSRCGCGG